MEYDMKGRYLRGTKFSVVGQTLKSFVELMG